MSQITDKRFENIVFVKYRDEYHPVSGFDYDGQSVSFDYTNRYGIRIRDFNLFLVEVNEFITLDEYLLEKDNKYSYLTPNPRWFKILNERLFNIGDKVSYQGRKFTIAKMEFINSGWKYAQHLSDSYVYFQNELQLVYDFSVLKKKIQNLEL